MPPPIIVKFPLRGQWLAPNTPGSKIPSHGTERFGSKYAYDFIQVDWNKKGWPAYRKSLFHYLLFGLNLKDYFCYGKDVFSPLDGIIVKAKDGFLERSKTNLVSDAIRANENAHKFDINTDDIQSVAGNYVIIKHSENIYASLVHMQNGSIAVKTGQQIKSGDYIGKIGHSGNSFAPHLHFQLMDSDDISKANGLPCAFTEYEIFKNGKWEKIFNGIPTNKDRIRFINSK